MSPETISVFDSRGSRRSLLTKRLISLALNHICGNIEDIAYLYLIRNVIQIDDVEYERGLRFLAFMNFEKHIISLI